MQLWLDASVTVNGSGTVSSWTDRSGNGRNLVPTATQPALVANQQNGLPVVRLNNTPFNTKTFALNQPLNYWWAFKSAGGTVNVSDILADGNTLASGAFGVNSSPSTSAFFGSSLSVAQVPSTFGVWGFVINGNTSSIQKNGAVLSNNPAGATNPGGFTLGSLVGGLRPIATADIGELLIVSGTLATNIVANINQYMMRKWGVS